MRQSETRVSQSSMRQSKDMRQSSSYALISQSCVSQGHARDGEVTDDQQGTWRNKNTQHSRLNARMRSSSAEDPQKAIRTKLKTALQCAAEFVRTSCNKMATYDGDVPSSLHLVKLRRPHVPKTTRGPVQHHAAHTICCIMRVKVAASRTKQPHITAGGHHQIVPARPHNQLIPEGPHRATQHVPFSWCRAVPASCKCLVSSARFCCCAVEDALTHLRKLTCLTCWM
jgi:hypothetical protein